jgi:hypothetical protein
MKAAMKAKKSMKSMKSMKAKKSMRKMKAAMRVSKIGKGRLAKSQVLKGKKMKTVGGLTAKDLMKNKNGKVVSKKRSARGKKNQWILAVQRARKELKVKGFTAVKKGSALYNKAKSYYKK